MQFPITTKSVFPSVLLTYKLSSREWIGTRATQHIVVSEGMGYLHAKGILHKDLKSKNVFYDNGKVVITDFGLFSISGVLQAGRYLPAYQENVCTW
ncbi:UNVERIFIED_CONTAM: hypothetical protein K2H54_022597 [Gekko kuhli]